MGANSSGGTGGLMAALLAMQTGRLPGTGNRQLANTMFEAYTAGSGAKPPSARLGQLAQALHKAEVPMHLRVQYMQACSASDNAEMKKKETERLRESMKTMIPAIALATAEGLMATGGLTTEAERAECVAKIQRRADATFATTTVATTGGGGGAAGTAKGSVEAAATEQLQTHLLNYVYANPGLGTQDSEMAMYLITQMGQANIAAQLSGGTTTVAVTTTPTAAETDAAVAAATAKRDATVREETRKEEEKERKRRETRARADKEEKDRNKKAREQRDEDRREEAEAREMEKRAREERRQEEKEDRLERQRGKDQERRDQRAREEREERRRNSQRQQDKADDEARKDRERTETEQRQARQAATDAAAIQQARNLADEQERQAEMRRADRRAEQQRDEETRVRSEERRAKEDERREELTGQRLRREARQEETQREERKWAYEEAKSRAAAEREERTRRERDEARTMQFQLRAAQAAQGGASSEEIATAQQAELRELQNQLVEEQRRSKARLEELQAQFVTRQTGTRIKKEEEEARERREREDAERSRGQTEAEKHATAKADLRAALEDKDKAERQLGEAREVLRGERAANTAKDESLRAVREAEKHANERQREATATRARQEATRRASEPSPTTARERMEEMTAACAMWPEDTQPPDDQQVEEVWSLSGMQQRLAKVLKDDERAAEMTCRLNPRTVTKAEADGHTEWLLESIQWMHEWELDKIAGMYSAMGGQPGHLGGAHDLDSWTDGDCVHITIAVWVRLGQMTRALHNDGKEPEYQMLSEMVEGLRTRIRPGATAGAGGLRQLPAHVRRAVQRDADHIVRSMSRKSDFVRRCVSAPGARRIRTRGEYVGGREEEEKRGKREEQTTGDNTTGVRTATEDLRVDEAELHKGFMVLAPRRGEEDEHVNFFPAYTVETRGDEVEVTWQDGTGSLTVQREDLISVRAVQPESLADYTVRLQQRRDHTGAIAFHAENLEGDVVGCFTEGLRLSGRVRGDGSGKVDWADKEQARKALTNHRLRGTREATAETPLDWKEEATLTSGECARINRAHQGGRKEGGETHGREVETHRGEGGRRRGGGRHKATPRRRMTRPTTPAKEKQAGTPGAATEVKARRGGKQDQEQRQLEPEPGQEEGGKRKDTLTCVFTAVGVNDNTKWYVLMGRRRGKTRGGGPPGLELFCTNDDLRGRRGNLTDNIREMVEAECGEKALTDATRTGKKMCTLSTPTEGGGGKTARHRVVHTTVGWKVDVTTLSATNYTDVGWWEVKDARNMGGNLMRRSKELLDILHTRLETEFKQWVQNTSPCKECRNRIEAKKADKCEECSHSLCENCGVRDEQRGVEEVMDTRTWDGGRGPRRVTKWGVTLCTGCAWTKRARTPAAETGMVSTEERRVAKLWKSADSVVSRRTMDIIITKLKECIDVCPTREGVVTVAGLQGTGKSTLIALLTAALKNVEAHAEQREEFHEALLEYLGAVEILERLQLGRRRQLLDTTQGAAQKVRDELRRRRASNGGNGPTDGISRTLLRGRVATMDAWNLYKGIDEVLEETQDAETTEYVNGVLRGEATMGEWETFPAYIRARQALREADAAEYGPQLEEVQNKALKVQLAVLEATVRPREDTNAIVERGPTCSMAFVMVLAAREHLRLDQVDTLTTWMADYGFVAGGIWLLDLDPLIAKQRCTQRGEDDAARAEESKSQDNYFVDLDLAHLITMNMTEMREKTELVQSALPRRHKEDTDGEQYNDDVRTQNLPWLTAHFKRVGERRAEAHEQEEADRAEADKMRKEGEEQSENGYSEDEDEGEEDQEEWEQRDNKDETEEESEEEEEPGTQEESESEAGTEELGKLEDRDDGRTGEETGDAPESEKFTKSGCCVPGGCTLRGGEWAGGELCKGPCGNRYHAQCCKPNARTIPNWCGCKGDNTRRGMTTAPDIVAQRTPPCQACGQEVGDTGYTRTGCKQCDRQCCTTCMEDSGNCGTCTSLRYELECFTKVRGKKGEQEWLAKWTREGAEQTWIHENVIRMTGEA